MNTHEQIVTRAEHLFDENGFSATGMDQIASAAEVSSRTLYKHIGNKTALITSVLEERRRRFLKALNVETVDALFAALHEWTMAEGARGCLFLRAQADAGGTMPETLQSVFAYRKDLRNHIARIASVETGEQCDETFVDQILVLFEGATSAASYRGADAIEAARSVAAILVDRARS